MKTELNKRVRKSLGFIRKRQDAYNLIIKYFISFDIYSIKLRDTFETRIIVIEYGRPGISNEEVSEKTRALLKNCPKQDVFELTIDFGTIVIKHKEIFED